MRLQFALNATLSTPSRVKVLRVLTQFPSKEFTGREVAELAKASPPQAMAALASLDLIGLLQKRKAGPATLWRLQSEHSLVPALRALFEVEASLKKDLVETIRSGLSSVMVTRAMMFGSFARGEESASSDVDLLVEVTNEQARESLQPLLESLGTTVFRRYGATLSPLIYTSAELKAPRNRALLQNIQAEGITLASR